MIESEWWAATKPRPLIEWLGNAHYVTDRKLRLLATACCWRVLFLAKDTARLTSLLALTESFADGKVSSESLREGNSVHDGDEFDESELLDGSLLVEEAVSFAAEKDLLAVPGFYPVDVLSSAVEAHRGK